MAKKSARAVLDTNVLISAIIFGGKPRQILSQVIKKDLSGVTSPALIAEFFEILRKKFKFSEGDLDLIEKQVNRKFILINPLATLAVLEDEPDNRVLEAALEGDCDLIITGDKELLELKSFRGIEILSPQEFLKEKYAGN